MQNKEVLQNKTHIAKLPDLTLTGEGKSPEEAVKAFDEVFSDKYSEHAGGPKAVEYARKMAKKVIVEEKTS